MVGQPRLWDITGAALRNRSVAKGFGVAKQAFECRGCGTSVAKRVPEAEKLVSLEKKQSRMPTNVVFQSCGLPANKQGKEPEYGRL